MSLALELARKVVTHVDELRACGFKPSGDELLMETLARAVIAVSEPPPLGLTVNPDAVPLTLVVDKWESL